MTWVFFDVLGGEGTCGDDLAVRVVQHGEQAFHQPVGVALSSVLRVGFDVRNDDDAARSFGEAGDTQNLAAMVELETAFVAILEHLVVVRRRKLCRRVAGYGKLCRRVARYGKLCGQLVSCWFGEVSVVGVGRNRGHGRKAT